MLWITLRYNPASEDVPSEFSIYAALSHVHMHILIELNVQCRAAGKSQHKL